METKDLVNKEKVSKYNLKGEYRMSHPTEPVKDYEDQKNGIIKLLPSGHESTDEFHTAQEQHNANHALYYFSMISDSMVHGRTTGNDCEKIKRIREHMMNLREHIGDNKTKLKEAVNALLKELENFCPMQRREFAALICKNWSLIRTFAEAYGHHDRCFPEDKYQKLQDVISGKCYVKSWWWKLMIPKLTKKFNPKRLMAGYDNAIRNAIIGRLHLNQKKVRSADEMQTKNFFMSLFSNVTCVMEFKITRRESYFNGKSVYEESARDQILYLLRFIKHHYPTTPKTGDPLWSACDYLSGYFNNFPKVTEDNSRKALQQMDQLCEVIGISYAHKFSSLIS